MPSYEVKAKYNPARTWEQQKVALIVSESQIIEISLETAAWLAYSLLKASTHVKNIGLGEFRERRQE